MKKAIICGGSIGGLFAAAALRKSGWQVDVFERTEIELSGRGAGIVTHDVLIEALRAIDITTHDLGVYVKDRTAYDKNGNEIDETRVVGFMESEKFLDVLKLVKK